MIEEAEAMESWRREFQLSEWAVFLIEMMEQEGKSEVEVRKQYTRYWAFSEVRKNISQTHSLERTIQRPSRHWKKALNWIILI